MLFKQRNMPTMSGFRVKTNFFCTLDMLGHTSHPSNGKKFKCNLGRILVFCFSLVSVLNAVDEICYFHVGVLTNEYEAICKHIKTKTC